jgi:hypothetical protein
MRYGLTCTRSTLTNPNVSEKAKQHAQEVLCKEFHEGETKGGDHGAKNPANVARGLKA